MRSKRVRSGSECDRLHANVTGTAVGFSASDVASSPLLKHLHEDGLGIDAEHPVPLPLPALAVRRWQLRTPPSKLKLGDLCDVIEVRLFTQSRLQPRLQMPACAAEQLCCVQVARFLQSDLDPWASFLCGRLFPKKRGASTTAAWTAAEALPRDALVAVLAASRVCTECGLSAMLARVPPPAYPAAFLACLSSWRGRVGVSCRPIGDLHTAFVQAAPALAHVHWLALTFIQGAEAGLLELAPRLSLLRDLRRFSTNCSGLGYLEATTLVAALQPLPHLTELDLSENKMHCQSSTFLIPAEASLSRHWPPGTLPAAPALVRTRAQARAASAEAPSALDVCVPQPSLLGAAPRRPGSMPVVSEAAFARRAAALAAALGRLPSLVVLDIAGNDMPGTVLATMLTALPQLVRLDIGNNAIKRSGAAALAPPLGRLSGLARLSLRHAWLRESGAHRLAAPLAEFPRLTHLDLAFCAVAAGGATALAPVLAGCTNLVHLDLSHAFLGTEGATAVATALVRLTALTLLDLTCNLLRKAGASVIAAVLPELAALRCLSVASNGLEDDGAAALAPALAELPALRALDCAANEIGDHGVTALAPHLSRLAALSFLDLSANELPSHTLLSIVPALKALSAMRELRLHNNALTTRFARKLRSLVPHLERVRVKSSGAYRPCWSVQIASDVAPSSEHPFVAAVAAASDEEGAGEGIDSESESDDEWPGDDVHELDQMFLFPNVALQLFLALAPP